MTGYPTLLDIVMTIGQVTFYFLLGIVGCACAMKGLTWLMKR